MSTIVFVENATTKEAGVYALRYGWAFAKGACRDINCFVHKFPWLCIGAVVVVSITVSFVCISDARTERDVAFKKQLKQQQQIDQLSCAVEAERSAR